MEKEQVIYNFDMLRLSKLMLQQLEYIQQLEAQSKPPLEVTAPTIKPLIQRQLLTTGDYINASGKRMVCVHLSKLGSALLEHLQAKQTPQEGLVG